MELTTKQPMLDTIRAKTSIELGISRRAEGGYGPDFDIIAYLAGMPREDAQRLTKGGISSALAPTPHAETAPSACPLKLKETET